MRATCGCYFQIRFGLHELAIEDALHAHQRPKIETYGETTFVALRTAFLAKDISPSARPKSSSAGVMSFLFDTVAPHPMRRCGSVPEASPRAFQFSL